MLHLHATGCEEGWKEGRNRWATKQKVGHGWGGCSTVVATSNGIIYAVTNDGDVYWYNHEGWRHGTKEWAAKKTVAHGWQIYKYVFASATGKVYGVVG